MRNFLRIAAGFNTTPLLLALQQQPQLWDVYPVRTTFPGTPVAACSDILLRFQRLPALPAWGAPASPDAHECIWLPASATLPQARPLIFETMRLVEGERLGRVIITRLPPGAKILPHMDADANSRYYHFYHLLLAGSEDTPFTCGDEVVLMQPGELWLFDNLLEHALHNQGPHDRLSLIIAVSKCVPW